MVQEQEYLILTNYRHGCMKTEQEIRDLLILMQKRHKELKYLNFTDLTGNVKYEFAGNDMGIKTLNWVLEEE